MRGERAKFIKYEYNKNPLVKHLIDNIDNIDEQEINSTKLLKWIRQYILDLKKIKSFNDLLLIKEGYTKYDYDNFKPSIYVKNTFKNDCSGKIIKWVGSDKYIFFDKSEILIETGDLLFVTADGIWNYSIFSKKIDKRLNKCVFVSNSTFTEYKTYHQHCLKNNINFI